MLLELFRNHKRWLMFIAMVLVIPSFVVTGIYSYNRMISDDGAIAKVDDQSILPQQFDEAKRQRLENRGRENASEINARLARAARYTPQDCHTLNNDGSLRQSVDTLLTLIHQKEKHHACL